MRNCLLAIFGTALLALSAKLHVPFWPVPMTMQTAAVMLIGATYGFRLATVTLALYLLEGFCGLPVFASGAGPAYMAGPTGGYLAGYVLAAALLGLAADRGVLQSLPGTLLVLFAADALIFAVGFGWLAVLIGPAKAFLGGVVPFLPGDILKVALVAVLLHVGRKAAPPES